MYNDSDKYNLYEQSWGSLGHFESCCNVSRLLAQSVTCELELVVNANGSTSTESSHTGSPTSNLDLGSVRRVSSAGDLDQGVSILRHNNYNHAGTPLSNETTSIIQGIINPCRYSPQEKKQRIQRYRTKRSQRNFSKKIQYSCRKKLADSRPRVRGRFARNDELEMSDYSPNIQSTRLLAAEEDQDEDDWIHLLDSISSNMLP